MGQSGRNGHTRLLSTAVLEERFGKMVNDIPTEKRGGASCNFASIPQCVPVLHVKTGLRGSCSVRTHLHSRRLEPFQRNRSVISKREADRLWGLVPGGTRDNINPGQGPPSRSRCRLGPSTAFELEQLWPWIRSIRPSPGSAHGPSDFSDPGSIQLSVETFGSYPHFTK